MYTKKNTRVIFRSSRRSNFKRNNNFSNGKPRNKGNVTQQYNKYLKLAKETFSSGDRIQSEYYYQFTDHYYRLMLELGINLEENEIQEDKDFDDISEKNNTSKDDKISLDEKKDEELDEKKDEELDEKKDEEAFVVSQPNENEDELESIKSISFISKPVKKKSTRTKKASA